jgi:hypothetical protein
MGPSLFPGGKEGSTNRSAREEADLAARRELLGAFPLQGSIGKITIDLGSTATAEAIREIEK